MKKQVLMAICLIVCIGSGGESPAEPFPTHGWELGGEIYYFQYKEPNTMKDTGVMSGIAGSYAYHRNVMLKVEARGGWGKVNYSSDGSGSTDNISDWALEVRGLMGYDFPVTSSTTITPFVGIGYRYLYDEFGGHITTTGAAGYDRESNYYYSPIGIMSIIDLGSGWSWGATAEYDIFWRGRQKSHLSNVGANDIVNQQNSGYGARGSVFVQATGKNFTFFLEPFVRYWNIDSSEIVNNRYEPDNNTVESGARLGIRF